MPKAPTEPRDPVTTAETHGACLYETEDGLWAVLDHPDTVLWWAFFRDKRTAAHAYCMLHHLADE